MIVDKQERERKEAFERQRYEVEKKKKDEKKERRKGREKGHERERYEEETVAGRKERHGKHKRLLATSQKHAIVSPRLKKPLNPDDLNSYRPISNLNFISKTIERVVAVKFNEHADANNLLPVRQFAYRVCYSTETAVIAIHNDISRNVKKLVKLVFLSFWT